MLLTELFIEVLWVTGVVIIWAICCRLIERLFPKLEQWPAVVATIGILIVMWLSPGFTITVLWLCVWACCHNWIKLKDKLLEKFKWVTNLTAHATLFTLLCLFIGSYHYYFVG